MSFAKIIAFSMINTFLMLVAGCSSNPSSGQLYKMHDSVNSNLSLVYFYQPVKHILSSGCLMVSVDNEDKGCVGNPGYTVMSLVPGEHTFSFRRKAMIDVKGIKALPFTYSFEAGEAYYFKHATINDSSSREGAVAVDCCYGANSQGIFIVPEDRATKEMVGLYLWE